MNLKARVLNRLKGWRFAGTPDQGEALPHWPCNYWTVCGDSEGSVTLRDPIYGYRREFAVRSGIHRGERHSFAFAEVSNGVFAVFERVG